MDIEDMDKITIALDVNEAKIILKQYSDKIKEDTRKVQTGELDADIANANIIIYGKKADDDLEAIGILTTARKQQRDKEAFAQATTEGKINMLAERLGLK